MRPHSQISGTTENILPARHRVIVAIGVGLALLISTATLQAQEDLSKLIQDARANFKPVPEEEAAAARAEVKKRMQEVADYVRSNSENGKKWMRYLRWDALKAAMAEDRPQSYEPFNATIQQLRRNQTGLENRRFQRLRTALQRYRDSVAFSSWDKPVETYASQLERLQRELDAYRKDPSTANQDALSARIRFLDAIGQSPKLISALRRDLARPNAFVDISSSLISASAGPIKRSEPVTDWILGARIYSQAHTTGNTTAVTIPSDNKAIIEFRSKGYTCSNNTGYKGPAIIRSTSDTNFTARKRVELTDEVFRTKSASSNATTDIHLQSVSKAGGGLGSRLVSRIGWRRAMGSQGQAEAISSDHAETRVENKFNNELDEEMRKARKRYDEEYKRPLVRSGDVPDHIRFSSDKDSISIEVAQASHSQIGATGDPPPATGQHDVTMRLHETAVDNYSASILGGATGRQKKPNEDIKFNVELPKWMKKMWENRKTEATAGKDEKFKEYSLTFRDDRPISVKFVNNKVKLTVHIANLKSGDDEFKEWDVTGTYNPQLADGRVVLSREGELDLQPAKPSDKPGAKGIAEKNNLKEELNKRSDQGRGFPKTIQFDPVKPEGKVADLGPLGFSKFEPGDGWLTIGLDRQRKTAPKLQAASGG
jgi:hypothetical protein